MPASHFFRTHWPEIPAPVADFMCDYWDTWELDDVAWRVIVRESTEAWKAGRPLDKCLADEIDMHVEWAAEEAEEECAEW